MCIIVNNLADQSALFCSRVLALDATECVCYLAESL